MFSFFFLSFSHFFFTPCFLYFSVTHSSPLSLLRLLFPSSVSWLPLLYIHASFLFFPPFHQLLFRVLSTSLSGHLLYISFPVIGLGFVILSLVWRALHLLLGLFRPCLRLWFPVTAFYCSARWTPWVPQMGFLPQPKRPGAILPTNWFCRT